MGRAGSAVTHDAHVYAWQQRELRRSLIRQLLRWHRERGAEWLRAYVERWPAWAGLRVDFGRSSGLAMAGRRGNGSDRN